MKEQRAAVMRPGVQCLAHGYFDLQLMERVGIEPTTLRLQDDPRTPLSYSRPQFPATASSSLSPGETGQPHPTGTNVYLCNSSLHRTVALSGPGLEEQ
ncbi:hypothetical protein EYF80_047327 [Liparis tanakae]|uniref:Uncharacterized protein n=1 Tax=Liparis tanakae TaxID=230148 RepID=A0A4Z2FP10_9TELE|nr:hypothetical protein EYF80_047327 [Liparis tanakae]